MKFCSDTNFDLLPVAFGETPLTKVWNWWRFVIHHCTEFQFRHWIMQESALMKNKREVLFVINKVSKQWKVNSLVDTQILDKKQSDSVHFNVFIFCNLYYWVLVDGQKWKKKCFSKVTFHFIKCQIFMFFIGFIISILWFHLFHTYL